jgi:hypothetical protein
LLCSRTMTVPRYSPPLPPPLPPPKLGGDGKLFRLEVGWPTFLSSLSLSHTHTHTHTNTHSLSLSLRFMELPGFLSLSHTLCQFLFLPSISSLSLSPLSLHNKECWKWVKQRTRGLGRWCTAPKIPLNDSFSFFGFGLAAGAPLGPPPQTFFTAVMNSVPQ